MKTKIDFFFCNTGFDHSNTLSQIRGKKYRYSSILTICNFICITLFVFQLLLLIIGNPDFTVQEAHHVQVYIWGGLVILLPIIGMLFGKTRMVISEDAIHTPSETIQFGDIERIELWPSWWRYEYWIRHVARHHYSTSYLCIRMKDGSQKVVENNHICRNIVELRKHVPTNIIIVSLRELLKNILLYGFAASVIVIFDYVGVGNKDNFAILLYSYFTFGGIVLLLHHLWSMFLSEHFAREYGIQVQEKGLDIAGVIFFGSVVLTSILVYFSMLN